MYAEKRKRKDGKDEFKANDPKNKQFSDRIKEMAKGRRRPFKVAALAKLRFRPKAKRKQHTFSSLHLLFRKIRQYRGSKYYTLAYCIDN